MEDYEEGGLACERTFFHEKDEAVQLCEEMGMCKDESKGKAARLHEILNWYQEQPQLIDCAVPDMVAALLKAFSDNYESSTTALDEAGRGLYAIIKVRSVKIAGRFFPHEAMDLEKAACLLKRFPAGCPQWQLRFSVFAWVSVLAMIPFPLETMDDRVDGLPLVNRLVTACVEGLSESTRTREAAALAVSRLLTRKDTEGTQLPAFLRAANDSIHNSTDGFKTQGMLAAVAAMFKRGDRCKLLQRVPMVLARVTDGKMMSNASTTTRKLLLKTAQRMALAMLPAKIAMWRYKMGKRSLEQNLKGQSGSSEGDPTVSSDLQELDEQEAADDWVFQEVEVVIDALLKGLLDEDTIVRWTSAKGIGRITSRLPQHLADDVVEAVLDTLTPATDENGWHGACLVIAELARRGLLLPSRLPKAVEVTSKALLYDERRGSASVGAHVRDGACYVCWGFARAYDPPIMAPFVAQLAETLLKTALFDREINCRRAASAAFQENVGRQGSFPHGLDILQKADFFTLSNRQAAFSEIGPYVASLGEYRQPLLQHLLHVSLQHWDLQIRELAAESLGNIVAQDPAACIQPVIDTLVPKVADLDLATRHGALTGLACMLKTSHSHITQEQRDKLTTAPSILISEGCLKGRGGELTRCALYQLLEAVFNTDWSHGSQLIHIVKNLALEGAANLNESVRLAAAAMIRGASSQLSAMEEARSALLQGLLSGLSELAKGDPDSRATARGAATMLGQCSWRLFGSDGSTVMEVLATMLKGLGSGDVVDVECRVEAARAASSVLNEWAATAKEGGGDPTNHSAVCQLAHSICDGLDDYTVDQRGDVGSWVRRACMVTVKNICAIPEVVAAIGQDLTQQMVVKIIRQTMEKIDSVRYDAYEHGLSSLQALPVEVKGESLSQVENVLVSSTVEYRQNAFEAIICFLDIQADVNEFVRGWVVSAGGLSSSTAEHAWVAFKNWQQKSSPDRVIRITKAVLDCMEQQSGDHAERLGLPCVRVLDKLVNDDSLLQTVLEFDQAETIRRIVSAVRSQTKGSRDIMKLCICLDCLATLGAAAGDATKGCAQALCNALGHGFPRVRSHAADKLYTLLLTADTIETIEGETPMDDDIDIDAASEVLLDATWSESVAAARQSRKEVADLLHLTVPQPKK